MATLGQVSPIPEYRVKAAFLFQFTQFVEWSAAAFPDAQSPLVIGVLGQDPFGPFLEQTVQGEKRSGHPLTVQRYRRLEDIKACHVLFVGRPDADQVEQLVAFLKGREILTVGDTDGFADRGGMIQFVNERNKVRLRINLQSAKTANLMISSKLLRLATVINQGTE